MYEVPQLVGISMIMKKTTTEIITTIIVKTTITVALLILTALAEITMTKKVKIERITGQTRIKTLMFFY